MSGDQAQEQIDTSSRSTLLHLRIKTMDSIEHHVEVDSNAKVVDLKLKIEEVLISIIQIHDLIRN